MSIAEELIPRAFSEAAKAPLAGAFRRKALRDDTL
jgi:hypothetical protein